MPHGFQSILGGTAHGMDKPTGQERGVLYSNTCEYAIRALTHLAQTTPGEFCQLSEIAKAQTIPPAFLGKILQNLVRAGILRSARGPGGGYQLAYPPAEISLLDVRHVIDGSDDLNRCAVGLNPCSDDTPCPLHETFKPLREAIHRFLSETTLRDLALGIWEKKALIAQKQLQMQETAAGTE